MDTDGWSRGRAKVAGTKHAVGGVVQTAVVRYYISTLTTEGSTVTIGNRSVSGVRAGAGGRNGRSIQRLRAAYLRITSDENVLVT